uniref:Uncharacterized protein n=1 Tax=Octopus bimaculoides TaxID=37653 RepID=A0A0L8GYW5_OCTBM
MPQKQKFNLQPHLSPHFKLMLCSIFSEPTWLGIAMSDIFFLNKKFKSLSVCLI